MKIFKKAACLTLSLVMLLGLSGCAPKNFNHKAIEKLAKTLEIDEYDDYEGIYDDIGQMNKEGEGYFYATDDEAQEYYDIILNRFKQYEDYDVSEFSVMAFDDESQNYLFLATFESPEEAKSFYKAYKKQNNFENSGKEDNYSYAGYYSEIDDDRFNARSVYLKDDMVLIIICMKQDIDTDLLSPICEELDIANPMDFGEED